MKNKKNIQFIACAFLTALSLISAAASCRFESGRFTVLTGNYKAPVLESFKMTGEKTALLCFSRNVDFTALEYTQIGQTPDETYCLPVKAEKLDSDAFTGSEQLTDGEKVFYLLSFPKPAQVALTYLLHGVVKDAGESTLSFSLDFVGYNSRVPCALLSEVSPVHFYAKDKKKSKAEFVELYILEDGNIGGMIIQSAYDGTEANFSLPAAEVKAGDYVSVHLRVLGENALSETGEDIGLSTTVYSSAQGRDIWNEKTDSAKTKLGADDVILLRTRAGGALCDALAYSRSGKSVWAKDSISVCANEAHKSGIWSAGALPENALCSDGITAVRTLCRLNVESLAAAFNAGGKAPFAAGAEDWKVLSGKKGEKASPGRPNVFESTD